MSTSGKIVSKLLDPCQLNGSQMYIGGWQEVVGQTLQMILISIIEYEYDFTTFTMVPWPLPEEILAEFKWDF